MTKLTNAQIAWRVAQDIPDGAYANLGIGFPEMVVQYKPKGRTVIYHSENGILDFGERPAQGQENWDLINAGKKPVTLNPGAAIFHQADSFAIVRGGHLDVAVLGAFQVSARGDIANWKRDPNDIPAVGGAMDLVHGAGEVFVIAEHVTKQGEPKLVEQCSFPLTGVGCVTRVYTSLAVIHIFAQGFVLREKLPSISFDDLQSVTGAPLHVEGDVADLIVPDL
ncbi:3-oxoacid CoA-transferase subunit B [Aliiroseovarius sp. PTFE2010]|uniref:3-oxoacid CoA-transferase subunit B n=1 Tax=Aliiroseovarius sp. PTFE2010 TaxID=3417190 RepID=UPI003CFBB399